MSFKVVPGIPQFRDLIARLKAGMANGTLDKDDTRLAKKLYKAIAHLSRDPYYPSLESHEIDDLTARYGKKVYQSNLENQTPRAGRLFWSYGPQRGMITLVGLEPHPEDQKNGAYRRVQLSRMPTEEALAADDEANAP